MLINCICLILLGVNPITAQYHLRKFTHLLSTFIQSISVATEWCYPHSLSWFLLCNSVPWELRSRSFSFQVTFFQECEPEFLHDLVLKMRAFIFTPGDLICRKGEVAREMFIIADGLLEVIRWDPARNDNRAWLLPQISREPYALCHQGFHCI